MSGPCKFCGTPVAPFGFRRRGSWTSLPEGQRTTIFSCGSPDCAARAKEWKRQADGVVPAAPARTPAKPATPAPPAQGSLF